MFLITQINFYLESVYLMLVEDPLLYNVSPSPKPPVVNATFINVLNTYTKMGYRLSFHLPQIVIKLSIFIAF